MDAEARERRIRLRNEERARRMQGGESIYDQAGPGAEPPLALQGVRPKTAISEYADQIFEEMMRKGGNLGEKTLAGMLPPPRYEPIPKPADRQPIQKPIERDPVQKSIERENIPKLMEREPVQMPVSRPQTAPKISKEQYKSDLLAQIEQERKRKEAEKAAFKGLPTDLNPVLPKPHVKKQDPNRPSADNPIAEIYRPQTAAPASVLTPAISPPWRPKETTIDPGQSLMDIDIRQAAVLPTQGKGMDEFEYEKAKLIYERQQAREELLRVKEEMLNEKERRLTQLMQMMQVRQAMPAVYYPVPVPSIAHAQPTNPDLLELPVERPKASPPVPYLPPRNIPLNAPVEVSLRSSSKLISPAVYADPSVPIFRGDCSPYESMLKEPSLVLPTPRNEVPLPIRTSMIEQFPDMASENTLTLPSSDSVLSSAREVQLSEPKYGLGDSQSVIASHESLRNEYENNFESALLQNFSLSKEWKGIETAKSPTASFEEVAVPYESEGENSPEEVTTPPPTTYTRQLLLEYRKQR